MIDLDIPGWGSLHLQHLVVDYNGTLARDGLLLDGVAERINALADTLQVHVATADTFGSCQGALRGLRATVHVLLDGPGGPRKDELVTSLGAETVVAVGNGGNDAAMLQRAAVGIAVVGPEGATGLTVRAADVVVTHVHGALDLLIHPLRLVATLRE
jgi:P-type E1-E2 ATPase